MQQCRVGRAHADFEIEFYFILIQGGLIMAVSEKQMFANRQNALQSTGPRSAIGKGVSSQNAIRHGLRAENTVISGEDPAEFDRFRSQLFQELAPIGVLESRLAAQIAAALWKFQRIDRMESDLLMHLQDTRDQQQDEYAKKVIAAAARIADAKSLLDGAMAAAEVPIHRVSFPEAQKQWFCTDDGKAYLAGRWPDMRAREPMELFGKFRDQLDKKAEIAFEDRPQASPEPADKVLSEPVTQVLSPEPEKRTDLSFQVAQQQRQNRARIQQAAQESPPPANPVLLAEPAPVPAEAISWGPAMVKDFTGSNVMLKFSRYRTQSERSLYRALNELNKLQYLRTRREAIDISPSEEKQAAGNSGLAAES